MALIASKTLVLGKEEASPPPQPTVKAVGGLKSSNFIVLSKSKPLQVINPTVKRSSIYEWRAEKQGKKSSFLEDMLTDNE